MGFWKQIGMAALSVTTAVGEVVITGGVEAAKGANKIYKDYQKNPNINLVDRVVETTFNAVGSGVSAAAKDIADGASDIYDDYKKEQRLEVERKKKEDARFKREHDAKLAYKLISGEKYTIYSKVSGVTYGNRQQVVSQLYEGKYLRVIREKHNQYDSNAVALYDGEMQLGYISKELSVQVASKMDNSKIVNVKVVKITGGGSYNYGANILIEIEGKRDSMLARYGSVASGAAVASAYQSDSSDSYSDVYEECDHWMGMDEEIYRDWAENYEPD